MLEAIPVSKLCYYIKNIFDNEVLLQNISVYGEVSNYSELRGNAYFNLKDSQGVMPCVYFGALEHLKDGDKIIAVGSPNFYTKGGKLNFNIIKTTPFGIGELYKNFLALKQKLEDEGLFDASKKKPFPQVIKRIGVVTSATGAVIHDIINVVTRRDDSVDIVLFPAKVQGDNADNEIISGIKFFEDYNVDVIVVARGGGSFEDLHVFNSEKLAREVFACKKFIMSAVGHETDYTIIDFVADLRAPTPSIAGELLTQVKSNKKSRILDLFNQIKMFVENKISGCVDDCYGFKQKLMLKMKEFVKDKEYELALYSKIIDKSNVKSILNKGFAYIEKNGESVKFENLKINDEIDVITNKGKINSKILNLIGDKK